MLKTLGCSIGTYTLKNIERTRGMEGYGFSAILYKGTKSIAELSDYGDGGGVNVTFLIKNLEESEKVKAMVYSDFTRLANMCKIEKESLATTSFLGTPYGAAEGFGELLLEVKKLKDAITSQFREHKEYAAGVLDLGPSWFRAFDNSPNDTIEFSFASGWVKEQYMQIVIATLKQEVSDIKKYRRGKYFKVVQPYAKSVWSLSFADYANMLFDAENIMTQIHK